MSQVLQCTQFLRIDLEALAITFPQRPRKTPRRAVALRRFIIHRQVVFNRDRCVFQGEMAGLVFLVVGI